MDARGYIYELDDEQRKALIEGTDREVIEDTARLDGYLKARAEFDAPTIKGQLGAMESACERAVMRENRARVAAEAAADTASILLEAHRAEFKEEVARQGLVEFDESPADVLADFEKEALAAVRARQVLAEQNGPE